MNKQVGECEIKNSAEVFERNCQRYLGIHTQDFLSKMDSGYFSEHPELADRAACVAILLPLVRRVVSAPADDQSGLKTSSHEDAQASTDYHDSSIPESAR